MIKICNKRISLILFQTVGIVILLALISHSIYEFVFVNNGVEYYRKTPYMLVIAVGIACLIGLAIWMFSLLLPKKKRQISLYGWGIANIFGMCVAGYLFFLTFSFFRMEQSDAGRTVAENAGAMYLKYVFGGITILLVSGLSISWWRLFRTLSLAKRK